MVWLLPRVDANVAFEGLEVAEAGSAGWTRIGLLSGVDQHVRAEVCHLRRGGALRSPRGGAEPSPLLPLAFLPSPYLNETRATGLALVRFLSRMDAAVRF